MTGKKILIIVGVALVGAAVIAANLWYARDTSPAVTVEGIKARDLEAIVSASGKIQPKRLVNISAETPGRVVELAVNEGDRITRGQFLLQIDPKSLRTRVDSGTASLDAAAASLEQSRQSVQTARVQVEQASRNLARQRELWSQQLNTREALERAENEVRAAESTLQEREKQVSAQAARIEQERAGLESARYDLSKVRLESPIDGIVTRRNIQQGETAVIGTMNNAGTVLLTLADMSVIQAEVEVDETNIPQVTLGQRAKVVIDALPDKTFTGRVTEIGNSPIQAPGAGRITAGDQLQGGDRHRRRHPGRAARVSPARPTSPPRPVRPSRPCRSRRSRCASSCTTMRRVRSSATSANGRRRRPRSEGSMMDPVASAAELPAGQTRKETEGVFVVRNGRVEFVPIKMGIAGEQYFEVLSGLAAG